MDIWRFFSGHTVYNPHWDNLFLSLWILLPFSLSLLLLHLSLTLLAHSFTLLRTTILLSKSPSSSLTHSDRLQHAHPLSHAVWPVKSHPKSMKSCPKMISLEKWKILTPLKNCHNMFVIWAQYLLPPALKSYPKWDKSPNLVTLLTRMTAWTCSACAKWCPTTRTRIKPVQYSLTLRFPCPWSDPSVVKPVSSAPATATS